jgi:hypothetical protein
MLWRLWQQHRADRAEAERLRRYLERHVTHRALCDVIVDARHRAESLLRLDAALAHQAGEPLPGAAGISVQGQRQQ